MNKCIFLLIILTLESYTQNSKWSIDDLSVITTLNGAVHRKQYPSRILYNATIYETYLQIQLLAGKLYQNVQCKFKQNLPLQVQWEYSTNEKVYKFNMDECSEDILRINLERTSSVGLSWHLIVKMQGNITINHHQNHLNKYLISIITFLYSFLTLIIIPYKRRHISQISIKVVCASLLINIQTIQTILYICLFKLFHTFRSEFNIFSAIQQISILISLACLGFYQFIYIFSFWKLTNRYLCGLVLTKIIFVTTILVIAFISPIAMLWIGKGLIFYAYAHMSIVFQLIWCFYASSKTPLRYILQCLMGVWTLVAINYFNPLFNFDIVSLGKAAFIGILSFICLVISIIALLSAKQPQKFYKNNKQVCQQMQIFSNNFEPSNFSTMKSLKNNS